MPKFCILVSIIFLGITKPSNAQKFLWNKQIGNINSDNHPTCLLEQNEESLIAWNYIDSTSAGNFKSKNSFLGVCVTKLDRNGNPKWLWSPDSVISNDFFYFSSIQVFAKNKNIYLCGSFSGKVYIDNKIYQSNLSNGYLIKLDSNGKFIKLLQLGDSSSSSFGSLQIDENENLFISFYYQKAIDNKTKKPYSDSLYISSITKAIKNDDNCMVLKLTPDLKIVKISQTIKSPNFNFSIHLNNNNNIIGYGLFLNEFVINGTYYSNNRQNIWSTYAYKLDSNLNFIKLQRILQSKYYVYLKSSIDNMGNMALAGIIVSGDTLWLVKGNNIDTIAVQNSPLLICIDSQFKIKWDKSLHFTTNNVAAFIWIKDLTSSDNFFFGAGFMRGDIKIDDFELYDSSGGIWLFKMDNRGNFIWIKRINKTKKQNYFFSLSGLNKKGVLMAASFFDTIEIDNKFYISKGYFDDILLMRINDIEITRGYVKSGPYCAGDTLKIPYTKNGIFNTGNQFIAQLSDENGNFEGKGRELGRVTSDTDGTIKGLLPLFDVESSPNYRIRILSTNPVVQSYYKYDTLRLLIYSKDTANAGKDTTICQGQTVKLTTTGGSRWRWSPGNLVKDSTAKTTLAQPIVTTKYRIIISDSSGCGKIDTAYKTITVWPPLKIKGLPKDTTVCKDSRVFLKQNPSGGLGINYTYQWISSFNRPLGNSDTFSINVTEQGRIKAVLGDGCSMQNDTQIVNFKFPISNFSQLLKDTLVCQNSEPVLKLIPFKGLSNEYSYKWYSDFKMLAATDTLRYKITQPETLKAIVTYKCSGKQDTSFIKLILPSSITAKIENPDCFDSSLALKITGTGGYKNLLNHLWYKDNKAIDLGKTIMLNGITKKQWIIASTSDYCKTTVKDSVLLFPNPIAKLVSIVDSICQYQPIPFFNQSNSFNPFLTALNNHPWRSKDTTIIFSETGNNKIKIDITDSLGCTATDELNLMVIEKPSAEFVSIPETPTAHHGWFELMALKTGYKNYNWTIGDIRLTHTSWQKVRLPITDTISYGTSLIVFNAFGCTDTVTKTIKVGVSDAFYIPNAVSRNDDGLNDEFAPYGWKVLSYDLLIVARTGQVVYKGSSPWKPDYENGVYSYVMKVKFKDGSENTYKGHVHVIH